MLDGNAANDIHNFLLPDCYIATGMFLICGPVT